MSGCDVLFADVLLLCWMCLVLLLRVEWMCVCEGCISSRACIVFVLSVCISDELSVCCVCVIHSNGG